METYSFDIKPGQVVALKGGDARVKLVRITEDSRCPQGVQCIWAGNVRAVLLLSAARSRGEEVTLNTARQPREIEGRGYVFRITKVLPPKISGKKIGPGDYVLTLEVSKAPATDEAEHQPADIEQRLS